MTDKSDLELLTERIVNLRVTVQSMLNDVPPLPDEDSTEASNVVN